jgi:hypothetical protein
MYLSLIEPAMTIRECPVPDAPATAAAPHPRVTARTAESPLTETVDLAPAVVAWQGAGSALSDASSRVFLDPG